MPLHHQISGKIAERLLLFQLLRGYFSLNHDFRFSGNFERHRFTSHELHRPVSDRARNSQLVQAIREIGSRHIVDVGERTQNDRHGQRLAAALRVGIMIEHGVMRRTDSGEQTIRRSKVAAVHSHVADAGLGIARNKWTCDTRIAAKSRFLNRRRKHRQANFFKLRADMNLFVSRSARHDDRLDRPRDCMAPSLVNIPGVFTTHA